MSLRGNIALSACAGIFGLTLASGAGFGLALFYTGLVGLTFATAFAIRDAANAAPAVAARGRAAAVAAPAVVAPAPAVVVAPTPRFRTVFNPFATLFRRAQVVHHHGPAHTRRFVATHNPPANHAFVGHATRVHTPAAALHGARQVQHTRVVGGVGPQPHAPNVTHTRTFARH